MEPEEVVSKGACESQSSLCPQGAGGVSPSPPALLTVVVEVELGPDPGSKEMQDPTFLLDGPKGLCLLHPGPLGPQEQRFTFDRVLGTDAAQEAEQELLAGVQPMLASVSRGYSVALLLRGREAEAPRLVPQLLQKVFEEARAPGGSHPVLNTLSLVQMSSGGRTRDLLCPGPEDLSVLEVAPLGLVVEDASEVEVSDSRAASELFLQAAEGDSRAYSLLTLTMSSPGPDPPKRPGTQQVCRGTLRIMQLPGALDCPLLRVLAGEAVGEEAEGCVPWVVSRLLEGSSYSGLLLRLDLQGSSVSLLQAALLGASRRRMQVKQVRPTLWDAVEETQNRRASLKTLRSGLLGDILTDGGLNRLGRALRELQVVKAWSQYSRRQTSKGARTGSVKLPEPQVKGEQVKCCKQGRRLTHLSGRMRSVGSGLHQKPLFKNSEEQAWQDPDVALQFFLAQARRQRLREQHQIQMEEVLKRMEQDEKVAEQIEGLAAGEASEERWRWCEERRVLRCHVEALRVERDIAERDLADLYDLHVRATRIRTCHLLQVFQAWQGLWEEKSMTAEHRHRSLLAGVLQDSIDLALKNQELQAQVQQLQQNAGWVGAGSCPGEKPDGKPFGVSVFPPHS